MSEMLGGTLWILTNTLNYLWITFFRQFMFTAGDLKLWLCLWKRKKKEEKKESKWCTLCASRDGFAIILSLIDERVVLALSPQRFHSTSANMLLFTVQFDIIWFVSMLWNCGKTTRDLIPAGAPIKIINQPMLLFIEGHLCGWVGLYEQ